MMENIQNNNQNKLGGVSESVNKIKQIAYKPNYSIMLLTDADLSKIVVSNLQEMFTGVVGVSITRQKDTNMPIRIRVALTSNSDMFNRAINPNLARLIKSDDIYEVTEEARKKLEPFITPRTSLEVHTAMDRRQRNVILSIDLHPLKTLATCVRVEEDTTIRIGKIQEISKHNFVMEIENFPKQVPAKNNKNKNKENNRNFRR